MMGQDNEEGVEEMEVVGLHDPLSTSKSYASYRSALSALSSTSHPLAPSIVATSAESDPLIAPPPYRDRRNPNQSDDSHVDSPSSSDVNSSSFDGNSVSEINGVESSSGSSSQYVKITVSNPQKELEGSSSIVPGGNTYWTYLITTRTNVKEFGGSEFSVRRRFKDVVMLSDRLAEVYRGMFVPVRPDKSVVESQVMQKQEFVELRRVALEKYLRKLAVHPVIGKSDEFKAFLQSKGELPFADSRDVASRMLDGVGELPKQVLGKIAMVGPQEVGQPAKGGRNLFRLFKELKQSVGMDWGNSKPTVVEEDKEFLEKKQMILDLEQQLTNASRQAEVLVKAQEKMGDTMGDLGLSLIKLTKFENEEAVLNCQRIRAGDTKNAATTVIKASRFYRGLNSQTVKHLDTLHDYLSLMLSAHSAFSDRSSALLTVQTLLSELSSLHSRAEKLEVASSKVLGGDISNMRKLEELKHTIRVTEDAKNVAVRKYEVIKENNKSELERLERERKADFLNMLKGFVVNQAGYAEKMGNLWTKVAEDTSCYAKDNA